MITLPDKKFQKDNDKNLWRPTSVLGSSHKFCLGQTVWSASLIKRFTRPTEEGKDSLYLLDITTEDRDCLVGSPENHGGIPSCAIEMYPNEAPLYFFVWNDLQVTMGRINDDRHRRRFLLHLIGRPVRMDMAQEPDWKVVVKAALVTSKINPVKPRLIWEHRDGEGQKIAHQRFTMDADGNSIPIETSFIGTKDKP